MKKTLAGLILTAMTLSGCAAYVGTKEAERRDKPQGEYGYVVMNMSSEYIPEKPNRPYPRFQMGLYTKKIDLLGGIESFQRAKSDLKIFYAKPGEYRAPAFTMNLDTRINHGLALNGFTIKPGEATYIGDYHLTYYRSESILQPDGVSLKVVNNLGKHDQKIRQRIAEMDAIPTAGLSISSPNMSGGNFRY